MTMYRRPVCVALALVFALGVTLGACSSDDDEGSSSPASTASDSAPGGGGEGDIDRDGVVRIGFDIAATNASSGWSIDPTEMNFDQNDGILYLVFGRLMRPTPAGDIVPDLAEKAEVTDPNTITIDIRPDVTWHDGTPFDAESVRTGLQRTLDSDNADGLTEAFYKVKGIQVTGPRSLTLSFDGNAASWYDSFIASWQTTIIKPGTNFDAPIGAGPMQLTSFVRDQSVVLERWDGYWNADEVNYAKMELVAIPTSSPQTSTAALQAGTIDVGQMSVDQLAALGGDIEELVVPTPNKVMNMPLCKKEGPLADTDVRLAIAKAIDRESINEAVFAGTAPPATEFWPEGNRFFTEEVADVLAYDPQAAKDALARSAYPSGFSIDLYVLDGFSLPDVAAIIQQNLQAVGITANLVVTSNFVSDFLDTGVVAMGLTPGGNAGRQKLIAWTGDAIGNVCDWQDPELERIVQQLSLVSDSSPEAVELWDQANTIIANDALSVPIVFGSILGAYDSTTISITVEGVWPKGGNFVIPDVYSSHMLAS